MPGVGIRTAITWSDHCGRHVQLPERGAPCVLRRPGPSHPKIRVIDPRRKPLPARQPRPQIGAVLVRFRQSQRPRQPRLLRPQTRRRQKHNAALICLARRRVDVLFAMIRTGSTYQPPTLSDASQQPSGGLTAAIDPPDPAQRYDQQDRVRTDGRRERLRCPRYSRGGRCRRLRRAPSRSVAGNRVLRGRSSASPRTRRGGQSAAMRSKRWVRCTPWCAPLGKPDQACSQRCAPFLQPNRSSEGPLPGPDGQQERPSGSLLPPPPPVTIQGSLTHSGWVCLRWCWPRRCRCGR